MCDRCFLASCSFPLPPPGTEKRESFTLPTPIRACEAVCAHNATTGGLFDTAWRECHDRPDAENNHCRDVRGSCRVAEWPK